MQKRKQFLPIFLFFFVLSLIVLFFSKSQFFAFLGNPFFSLQQGVFQAVSIPSGWFDNKKLEALQKENEELASQLVKFEQMQQDNTALRDQFQTSSIPSTSLLPARVIGDPQFLPGISSPEILVIDKGLADSVEKGNVVIYQTNLVGVISAVSEHAAQVTLVSNKDTSFTAKTAKTNAQGVLTGQGSGVMVLGSVLLSDSLKVGDMVLTNGSQTLFGKGLPPGLVVGKIVSVQKNPSSLYQSAGVESLLTMQKLSTVFIMKTP